MPVAAIASGCTRTRFLGAIECSARFLGEMSCPSTVLVLGALKHGIPGHFSDLASTTRCWPLKSDLPFLPCYQSDRVLVRERKYLLNPTLTVLLVHNWMLTDRNRHSCIVAVLMPNFPTRQSSNLRSIRDILHPDILSDGSRCGELTDFHRWQWSIAILARPLCRQRSVRGYWFL